jgi:hypothetical protein
MTPCWDRITHLRDALIQADVLDISGSEGADGTPTGSAPVNDCAPHAVRAVCSILAAGVEWQACQCGENESDG